jgi:hypothetical protein
VTASRSEQLKQWAEALLERFRHLSIYGQLKVIAVGVYVFLCMATVVVAAPADEKTNQIEARIMVLEGDMVVGRYFVVQNEGRAHWYDVVFEIDGGFQVKRELVHAGEKVTLFLKDFQREDTTTRPGKSLVKRQSAPVDMQVNFLTVHTRDGMSRQILTKAAK